MSLVYGTPQSNGGVDYGWMQNVDWDEFTRRGRQEVRSRWNRWKQSHQIEAQERADNLARGRRKGQKPGPKSSKLAPKNSIMSNSNPNNRLVNLSSMKVVGKVKVRRKKEVSVSKALRAKVKKVMEGVSAKGSYTTFKSGYIGMVTNANTSLTIAELLTDQMAILNAVCVLGPTYLNTSGSRTLWGGLGQAKIGAGLNYTETKAQHDFNFFTIGKILDAASVCFNRKNISINPYLVTNNLSTVIAPLTGAPFTNTAGALKINVLNSFVQFTLKNVSARVLNLEIYECTPTLKFEDTPALTALANAVKATGNNMSDDATTVDASFRYWNLLTAADAAYAYASMFDHSLDVANIAKEFGFNFNFRKRTMILQPGETCVHSIQGPKGMLDFSKMVEENVTKTSLLKGFGVSCFMTVNGDMIMPKDPTGSVRLHRTFIPAASSSTNQFSLPIAMEIKESISVSVPEIAGFIDQAGAAGSRQMLTQRKKKIVYANFTETNGDMSSTTAYYVNNDQNPAAGMTSGAVPATNV